VGSDDEVRPPQELVDARFEEARALVASVRARWRDLLDRLDATFRSLQSHETVVSWKKELRAPLEDLFDGLAFAPVRAAIAATHARVLRSRVFVALHMHAGDGNVHTNLPVNSDDYGMLREATDAVARIMALARSLDGVVSGEHGIGITKLEYLTDEELAPFADYKRRVDPQGRFNAGKLCATGAARRPVARLHAVVRADRRESLILEASEVGRVADSIKDCLRCGKCKPVCATHVPRANLLYSPRNKILATSLLTEAFLYEEQTRRGVSLRHFDEFSDVADHCTVCHKCLTPCPVDIDFGDVSIAMRNFLRKQGKRRVSVGTSLAMAFLTATDPATIKALRVGMVGIGYRAQRLAHAVAKRLGLARAQTRHPPATLGKPKLVAQVIHFVNKPMPGNLPKRTSRALLDIEDDAIVPIIRDPAKAARRRRRGVLLPGLRLGAAVLAGRARDAGDALPPRRADRAAAGLPVLRLSADLGGRPRQGPGDHDGQPRAVPPRRQHAQLPRHQDGHRVVRHVHGPAAEIRVRRIFPAARCSTSTST
jgi:Fe-S oxidoreductase